MKNKISTLTDFVADHVASNFSVRPDTLDSMSNKVRLAVVELQKNNLFPESTIHFTSLDMKEEKRDSAGGLIFNYYTLPKDFRMLYNNGPALEIDGSSIINYVEYGRFITSMDRITAAKSRAFTIQLYNGEHGKRSRLIITPFPEDDADVAVTYYSNGADMPIDAIEEDFYMPVINHVLHQLGLVDQMGYQDDIIKTKRNRQDPAGQGEHHRTFARTRASFFGNHKHRSRNNRRK